MSPVREVPRSPVVEAWRLYFPAAALLAVAGLGAWAAQLAGAPLGLLPRAHGAFMVWGVLGTGIQGFLLTAYPKQNEAPLPGVGFLYALLVVQAAAAVGLLLGAAWLAPVPWLVMLGWSLGVARPSLARRWDATTAAVPAVLASGLAGSVVHALGGSGTAIGMHAFVTPMALAVLDRVLPFFSSRVTPGYAGHRLPWFLGPLLLFSWLRALGYSEVGAAGVLLLVVRQVWGWRPWPSSRTPMIAVLHLGVLWIGVSCAMTLAGAPVSHSNHALAIGGLGSLLLGVSMRVVRGHGGLPMELGAVGVGVLGLAQLAAVLRISGAPLPLAAYALGASFALWLARFGLVCWRVARAA